MKHIKRIAVITLVTLFCLSSAFIPYLGVNSGLFAYAESTRTLTDDEIDAAMIAYIQSHGGGFSASDHRMNKWYTAQKFNTWLFGEGSTFTREDFLQHVEAGKNQNDGLFFKFDGIAAGFLMNKMLGNNTPWSDTDAEYDTETGLFNDSEEEDIYSGKLYTDKSGNSNMIWVFDGAPYGSHNSLRYSSELQKGTFINDKFGSNITNGYTFTNLYYGNTSHFNETYSTVGSNKDIIVSSDGTYTTTRLRPANVTAIGGGGGYIYSSSAMCSTCYDSGSLRISGGLAYGFSRTLNKYYIIYISHDNLYTNIWYMDNCKSFQNDYPSSGDVNNYSISFYSNTNNLNITDYPDINAEGNLYITPKVKINGEYKPYIVNEGDTINNVINNYYNDSGDKDKTISEPSTSPDGGGSNNPIGGTPPNWNNPYPNLSPDGNGGFNFNFTLPDLNIDWNINGLTEKFPFSIPFDFIAFCRVLNAEPQTPEWSGTLTLPMVNYPFTFSLQQFDNVAVILRNMEFIGFCIALILATRALIKG